MEFFSYWNIPKIWITAAFVLVGTILLFTRRVKTPLRLVMMALAFFAFGVLSLLPLGDFAKGMGLHPSPMCIIEKPFLFLNNGQAVPLFFISLFTFVALLTIVSNKSFCGWACPLGALQELVHAVPLLKKIKVTLPFRVTNSIRFAVFSAFVVLVFALSFSLYEYVNAFHILHWVWKAQLILPIIIVFIGGLVIYRPFCYLICPVGLYTWVFEQVSAVRVSVNSDACTDCQLCVKKSPCPTVPSILAKNKVRPDCHACGKCIEVCPEKALDFKL
jgi:polyferredoxin